MPYSEKLADRIRIALLDRKAELDFWIKQCLDFNARAKSSKNDFA